MKETSSEQINDSIPLQIEESSETIIHALNNWQIYYIRTLNKKKNIQIKYKKIESGLIGHNIALGEVLFVRSKIIRVFPHHNKKMSTTKAAAQLKTQTFFIIQVKRIKQLKSKIQKEISIISQKAAKDNNLNYSNFRHDCAYILRWELCDCGSRLRF